MGSDDNVMPHAALTLFSLSANRASCPGATQEVTPYRLAGMIRSGWMIGGSAFFADLLLALDWLACLLSCVEKRWAAC